MNHFLRSHGLIDNYDHGFFNRGKMSQNGQEPVKQSGVGLTDAEGKKKYKQHYSGIPFYL